MANRMSESTKRPCYCNKVTSRDFYDPKADCIDCWSFYFDPYWSWKWGKKPDERPPVKLIEDENPSYFSDLLHEARMANRTQENPIERFYREKLKKEKEANPEKEKEIQKKQQDLFQKVGGIPCINLGTIVSRANCNCPLKFVHNCDKHGKCVRGPQLHPDIRSCLDCPDYEPDDPNA